MAAKLTAARQLVRSAAERYGGGQRCDVEAGMAKLFASEATMEIALSAVRICGGYGYWTGYDVERYVRDAPLMIVGEGTNEIQRNVVEAQLIARGGSAADPCSLGRWTMASVPLFRCQGTWWPGQDGP